jgi:hypothetical protein
MANKSVNPKQLWMQFEDVLAPRLALTIFDRAVYSHLLRHSLVVGKARLRFSIYSVADALHVSKTPVRQAVRRLEELGALRLLERTTAGHLVEMLLPEQIRVVRPTKNGSKEEATAASKLESTDFFSTVALRTAIHARERGTCFYCLRHTPGHAHCLDHVVPRVRFGRNSYRNLVSCCVECNGQKNDSPAPDFLRILYRKGRLTQSELDGRLRALKDLAAGKLRPAGFNSVISSAGRSPSSPL